MKYENIIDTHTHSIMSFDGSDSCYDLCKSAVDNGGIAIAITDHLDIDGEENVLEYVDKQFMAVLDAKIDIKGEIAVLQGIELGQGIFRKELSEEIMDKCNYDFVLGSIHNLENQEDYYYMDYKNADVDKILREYFEAELELAKWNMTDSLAHLTYPLRYIIGRDKIDVDLSKYDDIINEIFEVLIRNKKALELNISGLYGELGNTMPDKELIKRFRSMGGKYVTVGTDAHKKEKVCVGIDRGYDILKECGFEHCTVFVHREPWLIPLR